MSIYPRKWAVATAAGDHLKDLDWDPMVDAANGMNIAGGVTIQYPYSFIVRNVGGVYDAISGNGVLTYGGSSDVGGVDGGSSSAVFNAALAALTAGRTHQEKVVAKGNFTLDDTIHIPSYTILEIQGKLKIADATTKNIIENSDLVGGNTYITIIDGEVDGNKAGNADGGVNENQNGIFLKKTSNSKIIGVRVHDCEKSGIYLYSAETGNYVQGCRCYSNDLWGILSASTTSYLNISDNMTWSNASEDNNDAGICVLSINARAIISRNICISEGGYGIDVYAEDPLEIVIDSNVLVDSTRRGIYVNSGVADFGRCVVSNNVLYHTAASVASYSDAIGVFGYGGNIITGNYVYSNVTATTACGIQVSGINNIISNNNIIEGRYVGLYVTLSSGSSITGNIIHDCGSEGMLLNTCDRLTITGNVVKSNSVVAGVGVSSGITLASVLNSTITGNTCHDVQGTKTQKYGILESGTSDYNLITGNQVLGNQNALGIAWIGANTRVKDNMGALDCSKGSATITAAATSIQVTHGVYFTPSAAEITVTLTNLPTNDIGDVYVDTIGATYFTIHCRNVPGVATAIFDWVVHRI
jgi:parallel beta-helix repeat protein